MAVKAGDLADIWVRGLVQLLAQEWSLQQLALPLQSTRTPPVLQPRRCHPAIPNHPLRLQIEGTRLLLQTIDQLILRPQYRAHFAQQ